jgi:putative hydrolase of the HAD superfamily
MKNNGHIRNFVFDLDETLYPPEIPVMKIVSDKINDYMNKFLHFEWQEIANMRNFYKNHYGTTLYGLMKEFNINADEFLYYVHNINYKDILKKDNELSDKLAQIKGELFIYTNASRNHAINVLNYLGLIEHFKNIISIEDTNYIPKPTVSGFRKFIEKTGINCSESILIDNSYVNLQTAKKSHMQTALVWDDCFINNKNFDYYLETIYSIDKLLN